MATVTGRAFLCAVVLVDVPKKRGEVHDTLKDIASLKNKPANKLGLLVLIKVGRS